MSGRKREELIDNQASFVRFAGRYSHENIGFTIEPDSSSPYYNDDLI
jgi:hypothetical protein